MGLFNSNTSPTAEAFTPNYDIITGTLTWATGSGGNGKFEGAESGANVGNGTGRKLSIYLKTPLAVTGGAEERFTISVGCRQH
jgi:hypothetical protein